MLFPKEKKFYGFFEAMTEKLAEACGLLGRLLQNPEKLEEIAKEMKNLEEGADDIGHETVSSLHKAFITPIEREDINFLRQNLDDIMDGLERVTNRLVIYRVSQSAFEKMEPYFEIICKAISEIKEGVKEIRNLKNSSNSLISRCQKINLLENEGDELNRMTLQNLMNPDSLSEKNVLEITKQKEIFETLEDVIDCCEDVANVLEGVLIKNL